MTKEVTIHPTGKFLIDLAEVRSQTAQEFNSNQPLTKDGFLRGNYLFTANIIDLHQCVKVIRHLDVCS